jgi:hypothetical protein
MTPVFGALRGEEAASRHDYVKLNEELLRLAASSPPISKTHSRVIPNPDNHIFTGFDLLLYRLSG